MYVQVDSRNIHIQEALPASGQSEHTIVLIHGMGQDLWSWDPIIPFLADYHIIRYDLPGHGASGIPAKKVFHMHLFTDELYDLLQKLNVTRVSLVGYELGACIAMNFSSLYPELVERVITIAHPSYYPLIIRQKKIDQLIQDIHERGLRVFVQDYLMSLTYRHDLQLLVDAYLNVSVNTYEAVLQIMRNYDMKLNNRPLAQPVLHLVGEHDNVYPLELLYKAMPYMHPSILVQIPNAKSLIHVDNPEYTAQRIVAFVDPEATTCASVLAKEAMLYYDTLTKSHNEQRDEFHLRIDIIHRFEARINGRLLGGNWKVRKAQELLIYLLYHGRVSRERLYDQFWPDHNLEKAQNTLRVSISHLKKLIDKPYGTSFICSKRDNIELKGNIESDLIELLQDIQLFQRSRKEEDKELIARKISQTVHADILEGYYNDSILSLREELLNTIAPIIKWIANRYESQGRVLDSILYYKLMLSMLPDEIELIQKVSDLYDSLQLKGLAREWQERYIRELQADE